MSIYLRCLLFVFLYLFVFELMSWAMMTILLSRDFAELHSILSPKYGILSLLVSQAIMAYFFCFVMSRSDSTTISHYVITGISIGALLFVYKAICLLVSQNLSPDYIAIAPFVILQFAGAAYIFAKNQI